MWVTKRRGQFVAGVRGVEVLVLDPTAGEHPHATEGASRAASEHQDLDALTAIARQYHRRRRDRFDAVLGHSSCARRTGINVDGGDVSARKASTTSSNNGPFSMGTTWDVPGMTHSWLSAIPS